MHLVPRPRSIPRLLLATLAVVGGCRDWRDHVDPARAALEPRQAELTGAVPIALELKGHRVALTPRAAYEVTGYVAETSRTLLDAWDFVMPLDLALVWGPVADPAVLRHLKFHLSERYVSYRYDADLPSAVRGRLASHVANHHLIPATEEVAGELRKVRIGDLVTLRGQLVDVEIRDGGGQVKARFRTSLTRDDVGSGACEILWVEAVEVSQE